MWRTTPTPDVDDDFPFRPTVYVAEPRVPATGLDGSPLMQRGLGLLAKTMFILALGFYLVGLMLNSFLGGFPVGRFLTERHNLMHLTGAVIMGLL
jgi:hypothetical protein